MRAKQVFALLLSLLLLGASAFPAALAEDVESVQTGAAAADGSAEEKEAVEWVELHIASAEDLQVLASNCRLDSYSRNLRVILDEDLNLSEDPIHPIPSFGGVFEGRGHSITGLRLATDGSNQGLFRYIQESGEVKDLHVSGSISTETGSSQLGGLAGVNRGSISGCSFSGSVSGKHRIGGLVGYNYGSIRGCSVSGTVDGKRMTGGIAGCNEGLIADCSSEASVNITISEAALQLEDLKVGTVSALELTNAENEDVVSDSGGIVGYSNGVVQSCVNTGTVGYPHFSYNVGGIAGRQAGFLTRCENRGEILGRKDVGGIVGQMEPYLVLIESVNLLDELALLNEKLNLASGTLGIMSAEMQGAVGDLDATSASAAGKISGSGSIGPATEDDGGSGADGGGSISPSEGGSGIFNGGSGIDTGDYSIPEGLGEDISGLAGGLSQIFGIMATNGGELSTEMTDANNQLSRVLMLMANALNGASNRQIFQDISDELEEEDVEGRVSKCVNIAPVEGDSNVGGLIGDMGIEYEFDMEGNLAEAIGIEGIVSNTFETKCVASDNVNRGTVKGRKDGIGGVSGGEELGSILRCENYGSVESPDGTNVGGVVGCSYSVVRESYAMCNLSGRENVGGIAGFGTTIQNCVSMVGLADVTACSGAIAGFAEVEGEALLGNFFVHETLGGVDGISYSEKAYPISYEELLTREEMPEQFRTLHLRFVADGEEVAEVSFEYGGSISPSQIPDVPEKEGYTGVWPAYDYTALYYSATIEAEYTPREGALAASYTREGSPMAVVLVEGDFDRRTQVMLARYEGELPAVENGTVLEAWTMGLTQLEEGQSYSLRYLPPEVERGSSVQLYLLQDGRWIPAETEKAGSYLSLPCSERSVSFAAVELQQSHTALYVGGGVAAAAALGLVLALLGRRRKKASAARTETAE